MYSKLLLHLIIYCCTWHIASGQVLVKPKALPNIFEIIAAQKKALSSRTLKSKPILQAESKERGMVVIDICIDRAGKVVTATPQKIVNITDKQVIEKCIACTKLYKFETDLSAPEQECGSVTFKFSVN